MAEEDKDSKTFEPTQKKKQDAKKKGQTVRSKELSNFTTLLVSSLIFLTLAFFDGDGFSKWFEDSFKFEIRHLYSIEDLKLHASHEFFNASLVILLFSFIVAIASVIGNLIVGGWIFAPKNVAPKFEKLNPIKGLQRMFSLKSLMELVKTLVKVTLLASISFFFISSYESEILNLTYQTVRVVGHYALETSAVFFALVTLSLIIVVMIDAPYQFFEHKKKLMMSHEEIKRENKEQNGDPYVKGRQRRIQREMAMGRMMDAVPDADVIVTNPTHYSVALKYDESKHNAPVVVASGVDTIAMNIREVAKEHDVRVVESPELARSLYKHVNIGDVIPLELYEAVAMLIRIIREIDSVSAAQKRKGLSTIENIAVPEAMQYNGVEN